MVKSSNFLTSQQAKDLDVKVRQVFGISTLVLMENAGRHIAEEVLKVQGRLRKIAIFCGKGNNGGDGFVAARHLLTKGIKPDIVLVGNISDVGSEARVNLDILLKLKQKIIQVRKPNLNRIRNKITKSKYSLIIDALLGVGLTGEVRGMFRDLIGVINLSDAYVVSVDVPSGLDATTGEVLGCCVEANKTVTFVAKKRGMVIGSGQKYCGRIVVKTLGIPLQITSYGFN